MAGSKTTPITQRNHDVFLSHAHADKATIVSHLERWCQESAQIKLWYDSDALHSGLISPQLGEGIADSQAGLLVMSRASLARSFVKDEAALFDMQPADFQKVYLKIDDCDVPPFLQARMYIDIAASGFDADAALRLLDALHRHQSRPETIRRPPVYLARGSRDKEVEKAQIVTQALTSAGFRVVRDYPQSDMDTVRLRRIMMGCLAVVALVPHRPTEPNPTSEPILDEMRIAVDEALPLWLIADEGLDRKHFASIIANRELFAELTDADLGDRHRLAVYAEDLRERLRRRRDQTEDGAIAGAYCFFGHVYRPSRRRSFERARRAIEIVSGIPCVTGAELEGETMLPVIKARIAAAEFTVFDISDEMALPGLQSFLDGASREEREYVESHLWALNTCIEAGIALGAGRPTYLIARGPDRPLPFMFRNQRVYFYQDDLHLVGLMRRLALRHRRISVS